MRYVTALALATFASTSCNRGQGASPAVLAQLPVLTAELEAQNPNPVSVSPNGRYLLLKSMFAETFELVVQERQTGRVVARHRSANTQLAPTWRSDEGTLAFLADEAGDQSYRVHLWEVAGGAWQRPSLPATSATALRWAPRGNRFAYVQGIRAAHTWNLLLVDADRVAAGARTVAEGLGPKSGFIWSPDGTRLATVRQATSDAVTIVDTVGRVVAQRRVVPGGEVRGLAWRAADDALLVTARSPEEPYFALYRVGIGDGAVARVMSGAGDLSGPLVVPGEQRLAVHVNVDGEISIRLCTADAKDCRRLGAEGGLSVITGFSPDGAQAYVLHTGRAAPPTLSAVDLDRGSMQKVHQAAPGIGTPATAERLDIRARDGLMLPAYHWRAARSPSRAPAVILRIHGGPDAQSCRVWEAGLQQLVRLGFDVLSVNYRGSTGYGAALERAGGGFAGRVEDVLAARDFAVEHLGIPSGRIVLLGHSYGAALAGEAALREPIHLGAVLPISYTGTPLSKPRGRLPAVSVFHGAHDVALDAAEAKGRLANLLGAAASGSFTTFREEGHSFHHLSSWARINATVATLLGP
jgi:dipeptidyl aminopeptidase/acylaminoacyl peptidase